LEITEEIIFNHDIQMPQENPSSFQNETSFTHQGIAVRLTFADEGKSLDDLLINYFKNLKQS
jgi:hypothetical protein